EGLDAYDTVRATRTIAEYIDDLSTWYVRRSRGRADAEFFTTLYDALSTTSKVIAPFMPHLAETLYKNLIELFGDAEGESVHLVEWPSAKKISLDDKKILADMRIVRDEASRGLSLRNELKIPVKEPRPTYSTATIVPVQFYPILQNELNVKSIIIDSSLGESVVFGDLTDELRREGEVRAARRAIQEARKLDGFRVGEENVLVLENTIFDSQFEIIEAGAKGTGTAVIRGELKEYSNFPIRELQVEGKKIRSQFQKEKA
ncbi:MAG: class I tRNA ligase family protein, partial [Patescibacteria group bacterium]